MLTKLFVFVLRVLLVVFCVGFLSVFVYVFAYIIGDLYNAKLFADYPPIVRGVVVFGLVTFACDLMAKKLN